jgi:hypothetical protein
MPNLPQIKWLGAGFTVEWISGDTGALSEQLVQINQVYQFTYAQVKGNVAAIAAQIQVATGASAERITVLEAFLTNWVTLVTNDPALICFIDESVPLIYN